MRGASAVWGEGRACQEQPCSWRLLFSWAGYPIPKPDLIFRLEQGEEPWVPDSPRPEEGDIVTGVYTGEHETESHGVSASTAPQRLWPSASLSDAGLAGGLRCGVGSVGTGRPPWANLCLCGLAPLGSSPWSPKG